MPKRPCNPRLDKARENIAREEKALDKWLTKLLRAATTVAEKRKRLKSLRRLVAEVEEEETIAAAREREARKATAS